MFLTVTAAPLGRQRKTSPRRSEEVQKSPHHRVHFLSNDGGTLSTVTDASLSTVTDVCLSTVTDASLSTVTDASLSTVM